MVGLDPFIYKHDLKKLITLQEKDDGFPAGHFCCVGRTGARIGNRVLTTALAMKVIHHEEQKPLSS